VRILISNDDGINAPGLAALERALAPLGEVWTVAPEKERSAQSHALTLHKPLRVKPRGERRFAVSGTPADCVYIARHHLLADAPPDIVVSGVNRGANLGADVDVSGTVAGAREATLFGKPAIAFSQYLDGFRHDFDWQNASKLAYRVLNDLIDGDLQSGQLYNVNFPDTKERPVDGLELVRTENDRLPLPFEYQDLGAGKIMYCGRYADRQRTAGKDIDVCFGGKVSISLLGR